jgi:hypothetical protein
LQDAHYRKQDYADGQNGHDGLFGQAATDDAVLRAHSRLLRRNDDACLDAFKIARGHVGVRVVALEILHGFDSQLPLVIVGPRLAVARDLPARAETDARAKPSQCRPLPHRGPKSQGKKPITASIRSHFARGRCAVGHRLRIVKRRGRRRRRAHLRRHAS